MQRGAICAQRVRTRTAVTCVCWQEPDWEKPQEGEEASGRQGGFARGARRASSYRSSHGGWPWGDPCVGNTSSLLQCWEQWVRAASWPGHGPAAELPKPEDGHLNHSKSSSQALGCRGCAPQSSAPPWLVQWEEMWPWPPAVACSKWLSSLFLNSFSVYNNWAEPWILCLLSVLFFEVFVTE